MNSEYVLQTGKMMKTVNGKVTLNKQFAFDYDGSKANIMIKDNGDLHEYKLSKKDINDMFTKMMNNKHVSLKEKLENMLEKENKVERSKNKKAKQKTRKKKKKKKNKKKRKRKTKRK